MAKIKCRFCGDEFKDSKNCDAFFLLSQHVKITHRKKYNAITRWANTERNIAAGEDEPHLASDKDLLEAYNEMMPPEDGE